MKVEIHNKGEKLNLTSHITPHREHTHTHTQSTIFQGTRTQGNMNKEWRWYSTDNFKKLTKRTEIWHRWRMRKWHIMIFREVTCCKDKLWYFQMFTSIHSVQTYVLRMFLINGWIREMSFKWTQNNMIFDCLFFNMQTKCNSENFHKKMNFIQNRHL